MKVLYNIGVIIALVFAALGVFQRVFPPAEPSRYLLSLLTGLGLGLGFGFFHLHDRIAALEKRSEHQESPATSKFLNP
jgi:hypothetical protein